MAAHDDADRRDLAETAIRAQDRAGRLAAELESARRDQIQARERVRLLESSVAFRLGNALLAVLRSPATVLRLPATLYRLFHDGRRGPDSDPPDIDSETACVAPIARNGDEDRSSDDGDIALIAGIWRQRLDTPTRLAELRVAAVLDEFSADMFAPDCRLRQLPATGFEQLIDTFQPHLLLVESAWHGLDQQWRGLVHPCSHELRRLVHACQRRGIPTVFWNKEDPTHFDNFLATAALFDHVFTTDETCVDAYRRALGHDRIGLLPFACQPRLYHPIVSTPRRNSACFAGSWYAKYPERRSDFARLVDSVTAVMPLDIFDRNSDRDDPEFAWPTRYHPMLHERLAHAELGDLYRRYRFGLTLNTVKSSPSMFARRAYELFACNCVVVSNPSNGLYLRFGDCSVIDDPENPAMLDERIRTLAEDRQARHRLRLRGLRRVMGGDSAAHRLSLIARTVLALDLPVRDGTIRVAAHATDAPEAERIVAGFRRQQWPDKHLTLVLASGVDRPAAPVIGDIDFIDETSAEAIQPERDWPGDWLALLHGDDYHGPDYLTDLALACGYVDDAIIGKSAYFQRDDDGTITLQPGEPYRAGQALWWRSSIVRTASLGAATLHRALASMRSETRPGRSGISIDEFGYCRDAGAMDPEAGQVDVD